MPRSPFRWVKLFLVWGAAAVLVGISAPVAISIIAGGMTP
jgi:hypothetical protein